MAKKKINEVKEYLIVHGLGYLKAPRAVKDTYGNPSEYPNPVCRIEAKGSTVKLIYEFNMKPKEMKK